MEKSNKKLPVWPLYPGALTSNDLSRFRPLNYAVLARALEMGLADQRTLAVGFCEPGFAVAPPSEMLKIFFKTSSYIDRDRDIQEELQSLSRFDDETGQTLWMILAQLILEKYSDPDEALRILQEVFQELGMPPDMRRYTLYGDNGADRADTEHTSSAIIDSLRLFLAKQRT